MPSKETIKAIKAASRELHRDMPQGRSIPSKKEKSRSRKKKHLKPLRHPPKKVVWQLTETRRTT